MRRLAKAIRIVLRWRQFWTVENIAALSGQSIAAASAAVSVAVDNKWVIKSHNSQAYLCWRNWPNPRDTHKKTSKSPAVKNALLQKEHAEVCPCCGAPLADQVRGISTKSRRMVTP